MDKKILEKTIDTVLKNSKERKFNETVELIITLKNITLKNKDQRVDFQVNLPHPYKSKIKTIIFIKDKNLVTDLKVIADKVVLEEDITKITKKEAKKLTEQFDLFLAEGPAMLTVGKHLGQVLSPRNKMPQVAPPNANAIKNIINLAVSREKISNKKNKVSAAIQTKIGKRKQPLNDLAENAFFIYNAILEKLPAGKQNIDKLYIKTTMGSTVKVGDEQ